MARLGEQHVEQAKVLKAEKKSAREIAEILSETYKTKFSQWDVYAALKGSKPSAKIVNEKERKAKANKKYHMKEDKSAVPPPEGSSVKDIIRLLSEIDEGYKRVFMYFRKELLRARNEVVAMQKGAGIEVPESGIE